MEIGHVLISDEERIPKDIFTENRGVDTANLQDDSLRQFVSVSLRRHQCRDYVASEGWW
jgi:hypothetical protein